MALDPEDGLLPYVNKVCGTVIGYGLGGAVAVQFDRFVYGHDCNRMGRYGYCWYIQKEHLRPISSHVNSTIKSLI